MPSLRTRRLRDVRLPMQQEEEVTTFVITAGAYSGYRIVGTVVGPPTTEGAFKEIVREFWVQKKPQSSSDNHADSLFEWLLTTHPEFKESKTEELHAWDYPLDDEILGKKT